MNALLGKIIVWRSRARAGLIGRLLLVIAISVFVAGALVAWGTLDLNARSVNWWLLFAVGSIGASASQLLNAAEYRAIAVGLGVPAGWRTSFLVTVAGSAANQLPLPGSFLVRTVSLTSNGVPATRAGAMSVVVAVFFLAAAFLGAGVAAISEGLLIVAGVSAAIAGSCLAGGAVLAVRFCSSTRSSLNRLASVEVGLVVVAALRAWGFAIALDLPGSILQFVGLSAGAALSTTVGVLPAGLGLTELLSGGVAALIGLGASVGLMIAVVDRLFRMAFLAVASMVLAVSRGRGRTEDTGLSR